MSSSSISEQENANVPSYLKISKVITYVMYIWILFGIIVLGLRVFLLALSASPTASLVEFVYNTSASFLEPFRGIWPPKAINETGYLDVAAIFAMIVYALLAWGLSELIGYVQSKIDIRKAEARKLALEASKKPATPVPAATTAAKPRKVS